MNIKELAQNLDMEEDAYKELLKVFIKTTKTDLAEIKSAIETGDLKKGAHAAHSIKGASGGLGLIKLSQIAEEIEGIVRNNEIEGIAEKLDLISDSIGDLSK